MIIVVVITIILEFVLINFAVEKKVCLLPMIMHQFFSAPRGLGVALGQHLVLLLHVLAAAAGGGRCRAGVGGGHHLLPDLPDL